MGDDFLDFLTPVQRPTSFGALLFILTVGVQMNMATQVSNMSDAHHCRCFRIDPRDIDACRDGLLNAGFEPQLIEENRGQKFGLKRRLSRLWQIHFKVMPDGAVEAELEPPLDYPAAHINQKHSSSPHNRVSATLNSIGIRYRVVYPIPKTCRHPKIVSPVKPLHWGEMLALGIAGVVAGFAAYKVLKTKH